MSREFGGPWPLCGTLRPGLVALHRHSTSPQRLRPAKDHLTRLGASLLLVLASLHAGCAGRAHPRQPDATELASAPQTAYGERFIGARRELPRTALLHLAVNPPARFSPGPNGGWVLVQDVTGLLSLLGLRTADEWLTDDEPVGAIAGWVDHPSVSVMVIRDGQTKQQTTRLIGPPPAQTTIEGVVPRAALVGLADSEARPLRTHDGIVGYRLLGPAFEALGLRDVTAIDDVALTTDAAVQQAVGRWLHAEFTRVETAEGTRVLTFDGPPTSVPAAWQLPVGLDLAERRARAGVLIDEDHVSLPREALEHLANLRLRPVRVSVDASQDGLPAGVVFTEATAELLGLQADERVLRVGEHAVSAQRTQSGIIDYAAARRALLQETQVQVVTPDRTLTVSIQGDPIPLPDDWELAAPKPSSIRRASSIPGLPDGHPRHLTRLQFRRFIDPLPTCQVAHTGSVVCRRTHVLWRALGTTLPRDLTLDGQPVVSESGAADWARALCQSTGDRPFTVGSLSDPEATAHYVLTGPNTPCP